MCGFSFKRQVDQQKIFKELITRFRNHGISEENIQIICFLSNSFRIEFYQQKPTIRSTCSTCLSRSTCSNDFSRIMDLMLKANYVPYTIRYVLQRIPNFLPNYLSNTQRILLNV